MRPLSSIPSSLRAARTGHRTLFLIITLSAIAAPSRGEERPEDLRSRAVRLTSEGAAAYKAEEFAQAIDKFNAAYGLYPAAPLLLNLSRAELKLSRCAEAVHHAEMFKAAVGNTLAASPDSPETWLAIIQRACIEAEVDSVPSGATIWINGERQTAPDKTPWTGRLPVGSHRVLLWRSGYQERTGYLDVMPDAPARLTLTLSPSAASVDGPSSERHLISGVVAKSSTETGVSQRRPMKWRRALGWSAAVLGVAGLAAGTGLGLVARRQQNETHSSANPAATNVALMNSSNALAYGADAAFAAGGVLTAAGIGLIVVF